MEGKEIFGHKLLGEECSGNQALGLCDGEGNHSQCVSVASPLRGRGGSWGTHYKT